MIAKCICLTDWGEGIFNLRCILLEFVDYFPYFLQAFLYILKREILVAWKIIFSVQYSKWIWLSQRDFSDSSNIWVHWFWLSLRVLEILNCRTLARRRAMCCISSILVTFALYLIFSFIFDDFSALRCLFKLFLGFYWNSFFYTCMNWILLSEVISWTKLPILCPLHSIAIFSLIWRKSIFRILSRRDIIWYFILGYIYLNKFTVSKAVAMSFTSPSSLYSSFSS